MDMTIVQKITILALPLIFAITLHEVAHGYIASWFGDQTARLSGRLTLNPIKHIDLVGTIIVPGLLLLLGGNFIFGWAKPVPVDARNLRNPRRDMALVALAGPLSNVMMAFFWALLAKLGMLIALNGNDWLGVPLVYMGETGIGINLFLGMLNLIPLPPLDGSKILSSILPPRAAYQYEKIEPYGFLILLCLMFVGALAYLALFVNFLDKLIISLFGL